MCLLFTHIKKARIEFIIINCIISSINLLVNVIIKFKIINRSMLYFYQRYHSTFKASFSITVSYLHYSLEN